MKIPKLKYYYHAMSIGDFFTFEKTRRLNVEKAVSIDLATGKMIDKSFLILANTGWNADSASRFANNKNSGVVRVLRIPASLLNKSHLKPAVIDMPTTGIQLWSYTDNLLIPHCGIEQFDLAKT